MTALKVLVVADLYYPPTTMGGPITAWRWATRLAARGHKITVLAPSTSMRAAREQDQGTEVVRYPSLPIPHWRADLRRQIRLVAWRPKHWVRRIIDETKPDLVHVHFLGMAGRCAIEEAARHGIPVLGTNHALPEAALYYYGYKPMQLLQSHAPWAYGFLENNIKRAIVKYYQRCSVMTAPSPTACMLYTQWGVDRPILRVSNGILSERFSHVSKLGSRSKTLARYGVPTDRQVIFYAGRTQPEKRVDVLLRAVKSLAAKRNVHLLIAGGDDAGTRKEVRKLALEERVSFAGYLHPETELPAAYAASDLFASASECEGQGIAFIEAMAAGLPVVAADKYATKDVVIGGRTGFLFEVGDVDGMAHAMERILSNPQLRAAMRANALQLAAEHDIERSVDVLEGAMRDLRAARQAAS